MPTYVLTVPTTTNGTLSVASASGTTSVTSTSATTYDCEQTGGGNAQVTVTATPSGGYVIESWAESGFTAPDGPVVQTDPSGAASVELSLSAADTVDEPSFVQYHTVTITKSGNGTFEVTTNDTPPLTAVTSATVYVKDGSALTINPAAPSGWSHISTTDTSSIAADTSVTVTFEPDDADADAATSSTDYIGHAPSRKHLLLEVPDYELQTPTRYPTPTSYIQIGDASERMGSSPFAWQSGTPAYSPTGSDLLKTTVWGDNVKGDGVVGNFIDDFRDRGTAENCGDNTTFQSVATPPNEALARGTNGAAPPFSSPTATDSNNATATAQIPSYVGWRDHTDGHRVTTTRGDKIEVIGGNYKLVTLGRGTGTAVWEMSGGMAFETLEAPGNISSVTWQSCPTARGATAEEKTEHPGWTKVNNGYGWQWVDQTVMGNEVERFHGTFREEFYGNKMVSVIGAPDIANAAESMWTLEAGDDGKLQPVDTGLTDGEGPTKWDRRGGVAPALQRPAIHESTWAESIDEYTHVYGKTTETSRFVDTVTMVETFEKDVDGTYTMEGTATYTEKWNFSAGSLGFTEQFWGAYTTIAGGNRFELFMGATEEIRVGLSVAVALGAQLDCAIGPVLEVEIMKNMASIAKLGAALSFWNTAVDQNEAKISQLRSEVNVWGTAINENVMWLRTSTLALQNNM